ncbi:cytochrome c6 [Marchantia polymorpha subsp. ruderalis]|uniref:Cytochrome c-553 n=2 Tax=Marchantia polymorpha TaxID=3197 RepID=A0AAF6BR35_MARPO|nr:hypothetical protein MARPO_0135s0037 [Marchantia polymorpha]BBN14469.1 hypothetical protein Mp_6g11990 [Marchantia polymorpha subsp. ruderalis]|eukprot:PTQ29755.1 hypothetical protein MARPO_0135s0037 [Marchantia polymorpha]
MAMAMASVGPAIAVSPTASGERMAAKSAGISTRKISVTATNRTPSALMIGRNCNVEDDDEFSSSKNWASSDQVSKALSTVTAFGAAALLTSASFDVGAAIALDGVEVGALFQRTCAGCHTGGGNVLQPSATLFNKDLDSSEEVSAFASKYRNGLSTVDDIFKITYFGKNRMPGYGEKCTPRGQCTFGPRLGEEDIRALAEFVKSQADQGWTSVQN